MQPNDTFLSAIKDSLILHLEDEVKLYCVNQGLDLVDDHEIMCNFYDYALENLFAN